MLLSTTLLLISTVASAKMTHEEAGKNILRMLALGPSAPRDENARAAFLAARFEAKAEVDAATAKVKPGDAHAREKREAALNAKRAELGEQLRAFEYRVKPAATLTPLDAFDAIKLLEEKDFLNTVDVEMQWEAVVNTARRVKELMLEKAGPKETR